MEYALNPDNLAAIGALDDFQMSYQAIESIYKDLFIKIKEEADANNRTAYYDKADRLAQNNVIEICDPLLNQYRKMFGDGLNSLNIDSRNYDSFSFLRPVRRRQREPLEYKYDTILLDYFLVELQNIVTKVLYKYRLKEKPKYLYEPFSLEVNNHIEKYVQKNMINPSNSVVAFDEHKRTNASLYIYDRLASTKCYREHHPISVDIFYGDAYEKNGLVRLPVRYCKSCDKYFMGSITYSLYERIWGIIVCEKYYHKDTVDDFEKFRNESKLHRYGYNVIEGNLSELERHNLLVYLIDQSLMTYKEIDDTIEENIRRFKSIRKYNKAVDKWKRDLKFISDFVLGE